MTFPKGPEYGWGDIIKVPPKALCPEGLHPDYGAIYGVIISSKRLWHNNIGHSRKARGKKAGEATGRPVGQYLVALIAPESEFPGMELKIREKGLFRNWVVATGLFVNVLDSQLAGIPEPERLRGRLHKKDMKRLEQRLKLIIENDWDPGKADRPAASRNSVSPGGLARFFGFGRRSRDESANGGDR
jgi:hypothetical protein